MNRFLTILFLFVLLLSCVNKPQKQNDKYILGDWVYAHPHYKYDSKKIIVPPPELDISGFSFYANHTYDNKTGFYRNNGRNTVPYDVMIYLGNVSKYTITSDSLSLFNLSLKKWENFKIIKLTSDSLQIKNNDAASTYIHPHLKKSNTPKFDKIIITTSGCFGSCPATITSIDSNGTLIFKGKSYATKLGLFSGKIPKKTYHQLRDNFRKIDFDSLKKEYRAGWTDDETVTTTFLKDGRIYKTVYDYGDRAPCFFVWAYTPLRNVYQTIPLMPLTKPDFIPLLDVLLESRFKLTNGEMQIILNQSEAFLLFDYLRNGRVSSNNFKTRFKLHPYFENKTFYNINTDGRFYTFISKGKPLTIDIGFNFYDINAKNWKWEKPDKYDK